MLYGVAPENTLVIRIARFSNCGECCKKRKIFHSHATCGNFHLCTAQMLFMFVSMIGIAER